ncbi:hypothetical protein RC1_2121 [Rhodospirillum centenum SW]|uniref:Uncharacterized protein n=1 Tax=Rhodospirillum centenum (strain ATCC 51521 / SW) TaxID=414684 RepID=B6ITX4_RHOCS|nr:hypothetical protein RC1_2121 [Rhodospirillum centenum SW]
MKRRDLPPAFHPPPIPPGVPGGPAAGARPERCPALTKRNVLRAAIG